MYLTEQNIEASIKYLEKKRNRVEAEIAERQKFLAFVEGSLAVWNQLKAENARVELEKKEGAKNGTE